MKGSGMPQIRSALNGWTRRITCTRRAQTVKNDGFVKNIDKSFIFWGTIQPLSPNQIELKPEGQRSWQWYQVHCRTNDASLLLPNDIITYIGQTYKIMGQNDYSLNGMVEYHAIKDYQ